jgi:hypothetical protein
VLAQRFAIRHNGLVFEPLRGVSLVIALTIVSACLLASCDLSNTTDVGQVPATTVMGRGDVASPPSIDADLTCPDDESRHLVRTSFVWRDDDRPAAGTVAEAVELASARLDANGLRPPKPVELRRTLRGGREYYGNETAGWFLLERDASGWQVLEALVCPD